MFVQVCSQFGCFPDVCVDVQIRCLTIIWLCGCLNNLSGGLDNLYACLDIYQGVWIVSLVVQIVYLGI